MRLIINILTVIVIGFFLGGFTAHYSIRQAHGVGAINVGSWSAWPFVGGVEIDPYTSARGTANGTLPLGAAEGLAFEASEDSNGETLDRECQYQIVGKTPPSRVWTLAAYSNDGELLETSRSQYAANHSGNIIRYPDGSFEIKMSNRPSSGNWMPMEGKGDFKLILRLYDTPITSNSGVIDPIMPQVNKLECNS